MPTLRFSLCSSFGHLSTLGTPSELFQVIEYTSGYNLNKFIHKLRGYPLRILSSYYFWSYVVCLEFGTARMDAGCAVTGTFSTGDWAWLRVKIARIRPQT